MSTQPPVEPPVEPQTSAEPPRKKGFDWRTEAQETKQDLRWAAPLTFFLFLGLTGLLYGSWQPTEAGANTLEGTENLDNVTDIIFATGQYAPGNETRAAALGPAREVGLIVPFEILSVLLLAALIAGIVIALREKDGDS